MCQTRPLLSWFIECAKLDLLALLCFLTRNQTLALVATPAATSSTKTKPTRKRSEDPSRTIKAPQAGGSGNDDDEKVSKKKKGKRSKKRKEDKVVLKDDDEDGGDDDDKP